MATNETDNRLNLIAGRGINLIKKGPPVQTLTINSTTVHKLMPIDDTEGDRAPYGYWIVDLEKPNPDAESGVGYDWANATEILNGIRNGETYVLILYKTWLNNSESPYLYMTYADNQSSDGQDAVRLFFASSFINDPRTYAYTSIYTYDRQTGRMAILNWDNEQYKVSEKQILFRDDLEVKGDTDPSSAPSIIGTTYRNTVTNDIWYAIGTESVSDWKLIYNRNHDLIVQIKYLKINESDTGLTPRNVLCDRQNYTINNGNIIFKPVTPEELAKWFNRGDVIQIDGAVASDPWGDRYPMYITEAQCSIPSGGGERQCTNIEVRGYKYSSTELYRWGNLITDLADNKTYMEFQGW